MPNNLPNFNDLTDEALIQLVRNRNEAAFTELIFRYTPRIWPIIVRNSRQRQDAEEIRNDVWMAVWQNIKGLQKVSSFGEWLQRIAYNACKRYYTSRNRSRSEIPHTHAVLVEHIDQHATARYRETQLIAEVKEVVHHLPQKVRSVAELFYLESWSIKEIAEALDLPIGTVKTRLREIRARLREEFDVEPKEGVNTMQDREPAQFNVVPDDPTGSTWALPKDAIVRFGKGKIHEIEYSPDGKLLAVASGIGIWLYDVTTQQEIALLTEHTSVVDCLTFSPDGRTFASGSKDGTILLWGYKSADGRTSVQTKLTVDRSEHSALNLAFSPDGKTLASGTDDPIRFWDTITGEQKQAFTGPPENINNLSFSPDGKTIVSITWGGEVYISDTITGKLKKTFTVRMTDGVFSTAFSPDGEIFVIGSRDGIIYLSDLKTGELKRKLTGHSVDVQSIAFSPDGKTLTSSGSGDGTIRFWDVSTGNQKHAVTGHTDYVYSVVFSPDGKFVASGYSGGAIRFWDASTGQYLRTLKGLNEDVSDLIFTSDGKTLVYADGENIRLQDPRTGEEKMLLTGHTWGIHSMVLSPDGDMLASGSEDTTIRLWDIHTGEHKKTLNGHTDYIYSVAFSPDGKTLASGSDDNTIRLWNVDTGETEIILVGHAHEFEGVKSVAFSPDGKTLASGGGDNIIHLWDIDTGKSKMALIGHTHWVFSLAFSPDGETLASGSVDSDIRLWDPRTGKHKKTLMGHAAWVRNIVFSPDGKTLVSGGDDGSVLLWQINP